MSDANEKLWGVAGRQGRWQSKLDELVAFFTEDNGQTFTVRVPGKHESEPTAAIIDCTAQVQALVAEAQRLSAQLDGIEVVKADAYHAIMAWKSAKDWDAELGRVAEDAIAKVEAAELQARRVDTRSR